MVERFFRDLTHNRLRHGIFRDVEELIIAIGDYIDKHNDKSQTLRVDRKGFRYFREGQSRTCRAR